MLFRTALAVSKNCSHCLAVSKNYLRDALAVSKNYLRDALAVSKKCLRDALAVSKNFSSALLFYDVLL